MVMMPMQIRYWTNNEHLLIIYFVTKNHYNLQRHKTLLSRQFINTGRQFLISGDTNSMGLGCSRIHSHLLVSRRCFHLGHFCYLFTGNIIKRRLSRYDQILKRKWRALIWQCDGMDSWRIDAQSKWVNILFSRRSNDVYWYNFVPRIHLWTVNTPWTPVNYVVPNNCTYTDNSRLWIMLCRI